MVDHAARGEGLPTTALKPDPIGEAARARQPHRRVPIRFGRSASSLRPKVVLLTGFLAAAMGILAYVGNLWPQLENVTVDTRFALRAVRRPRDVVVVGIDDKTFSELGIAWPFPRSYDARAIEILHADRARAIVYDVQFTEPTTPKQDYDLYDELGRAPGVVLATTEVNAHGQTDVFGGSANLARVHAVAAAANMLVDPGGVIRRYPYSILGLKSLAVAGAEAAGAHISPSRFQHDSAWIDFRGPPDTIKTVSFSDLYDGRLSSSTFAGKVVVVGATSASLQDVHFTSTTSNEPMSGAELEANAIWTAMHNNPLQPAGSWIAILAIMICGLIAPLSSLKLGVLPSCLLALAVAVGYALAAQIAFDHGTILVVSYPLAACAFGTIVMIAARYAVARIERNAFSRQLEASQFEIIRRLAHAAESRDEATGRHIERIGVMSRSIGLAIGMSATDAELLRHASAMHDVGKIAIPDQILHKPGKLTAEEWEIMKTHTTAGAEVLAGSPSPLLQMAETIARTHHERWDGTGYPAGLHGDEIPLIGRICAVCDVFDALLSERPYKQPWSTEDALAEIQRGSGTHFDPAIVEVFTEQLAALQRERQAADASPSPTSHRTPSPVAATSPGLTDS